MPSRNDAGSASTRVRQRRSRVASGDSSIHTVTDEVINNDHSPNNNNQQCTHNRDIGDGHSIRTKHRSATYADDGKQLSPTRPKSAMTYSLRQQQIDSNSRSSSNDDEDADTESNFPTFPEPTTVVVGEGCGVDQRGSVGQDHPTVTHHTSQQQAVEGNPTSPKVHHRLDKCLHLIPSNNNNNNDNNPGLSTPVCLLPNEDETEEDEVVDEVASSDGDLAEGCDEQPSSQQTQLVATSTVTIVNNTTPMSSSSVRLSPSDGTGCCLRPPADCCNATQVDASSARIDIVNSTKGLSSSSTCIKSESRHHLPPPPLPPRIVHNHRSDILDVCMDPPPPPLPPRLDKQSLRKSLKRVRRRSKRLESNKRMKASSEVSTSSDPEDESVAKLSPSDAGGHNNNESSPSQPVTSSSPSRRYPLRSRLRKDQAREQWHAYQLGYSQLEALPFDILIRILRYLNIRDLFGLQCVCKRLQAITRLHLRGVKRINFTNGQPFAFLVQSLSDDTLRYILEATPNVTHILGFFPRQIASFTSNPTPCLYDPAHYSVVRDTKRTPCLSYLGIVSAFRTCRKLRSVELMDVTLLAWLINLLPNVKLHGMFRNRPDSWDGEYAVDMPSEPIAREQQLSSLDTSFPRPSIDLPLVPTSLILSYFLTHLLFNHSLYNWVPNSHRDRQLASKVIFDQLFTNYSARQLDTLKSSLFANRSPSLTTDSSTSDQQRPSTVKYIQLVRAAYTAFSQISSKVKSSQFSGAWFDPVGELPVSEGTASFQPYAACQYESPHEQQQYGLSPWIDPSNDAELLDSDLLQSRLDAQFNQEAFQSNLTSGPLLPPDLPPLEVQVIASQLSQAIVVNPADPHLPIFPGPTQAQLIEIPVSLDFSSFEASISKHTFLLVGLPRNVAKPKLWPSMRPGPRRTFNEMTGLDNLRFPAPWLPPQLEPAVPLRLPRLPPRLPPLPRREPDQPPDLAPGPHYHPGQIYPLVSPTDEDAKQAQGFYEGRQLVTYHSSGVGLLTPLPCSLSYVTMPGAISNVTKLDLVSVAITSLPKLENVKYLHLKWVANVIRRVFTDEQLSHRRFRSLQRLVLAGNKSLTESDVGLMLITSAPTLLHLALPPSVCRNSLLEALSHANVQFERLDSLVLGYQDPYQSQLTSSELESLSLFDMSDHRMPWCSPLSDWALALLLSSPNACKRLSSLTLRHAPHLIDPGQWCGGRERSGYVDHIPHPDAGESGVRRENPSEPPTPVRLMPSTPPPPTQGCWHLRSLTLENCPAISMVDLEQCLATGLPYCHLETLILRDMFLPVKRPDSSLFYNSSLAFYRSLLGLTPRGDSNSSNQQAVNHAMHSLDFRLLHFLHFLSDQLVLTGLGHPTAVADSDTGSIASGKSVRRVTPETLFLDPNSGRLHHQPMGMPPPRHHQNQQNPLVESLRSMDFMWSIRLHQYLQGIAEADGFCVGGNDESTSQDYPQGRLLAALIGHSYLPSVYCTQAPNTIRSRENRQQAAANQPQDRLSSVRSVACQTCVCGLLEVDIMRRLASKPNLPLPPPLSQYSATPSSATSHGESFSSNSNGGRLSTGPFSWLSQRARSQEGGFGGLLSFHPYAQSLQHRQITRPMKESGSLWWLTYLSRQWPDYHQKLTSSHSKLVPSLTSLACAGCEGLLAIDDGVDDEQDHRLAEWIHLRPPRRQVVDACLDTVDLHERLFPAPSLFTVKQLSNRYSCLTSLHFEKVGITHLVLNNAPNLKHVTLDCCPHLRAIVFPRSIISSLRSMNLATDRHRPSTANDRLVQLESTGCLGSLRRIRILRCPKFAIYHLLYALGQLYPEHQENISVAYRPFGQYNVMVEQALWSSSLYAHVCITHDLNKETSEREMDACNSQFSQQFRDLIFTTEMLIRTNFAAIHPEPGPQPVSDASAPHFPRRLQTGPNWRLLTDIPRYHRHCQSQSQKTHSVLSATTDHSDSSSDFSTSTGGGGDNPASGGHHPCRQSSPEDRDHQQHPEPSFNGSSSGTGPRKMQRRGIHLHVQFRDCHTLELPNLAASTDSGTGPSDSCYHLWPYTQNYLSTVHPSLDYNVWGDGFDPLLAGPLEKYKPLKSLKPFFCSSTNTSTNQSPSDSSRWTRRRSSAGATTTTTVSPSTSTTNDQDHQQNRQQCIATRKCHSSGDTDSCCGQHGNGPTTSRVEDGSSSQSANCDDKQSFQMNVETTNGSCFDDSAIDLSNSRVNANRKRRSGSNRSNGDSGDLLLGDSSPPKRSRPVNNDDQHVE